MTSLAGHRASLWTYYDRRAPEYDGGIDGAYRYFRGIGVHVDGGAIRAERQTLTKELARLPPCVFVDVGAGPGVFTAQIPGPGIALDQSENALGRLRVEVGDVPVLRADATALPQRFEFDGYQQLESDMKRDLGEAGWWFDTSALTPTETAEQLVPEAAERAVPVHGDWHTRSQPRPFSCWLTERLGRFWASIR